MDNSQYLIRKKWTVLKDFPCILILFHFINYASLGRKCKAGTKKYFDLFLQMKWGCKSWIPVLFVPPHHQRQTPPSGFETYKRKWSVIKIQHAMLEFPCFCHVLIFNNNNTSGTRPRTPDTYRTPFAFIAWEYGPNAAGALSVSTASNFPITQSSKSIRIEDQNNSHKESDKYQTELHVKANAEGNRYK